MRYVTSVDDSGWEYQMWEYVRYEIVLKDYVSLRFLFFEFGYHSLETCFSARLQTLFRSTRCRVRAVRHGRNSWCVVHSKSQHRTQKFHEVPVFFEQAPRVTVPYVCIRTRYDPVIWPSMENSCAIMSGLLWRMLLGDTSNLQDAARV